MRKTLLSVLPFIVAPCLAQRPSIRENGVLEAASYTSGIAPGSLFVVRGSDLSAGGVHWAGMPLPTRLAGVSINVAPISGGAGIEAFLLYTYNQDGANQLAALLPSSVTPGDYNVTVTFNGDISEPAKATVVARNFGVMTASGTGVGRALIQNYVSPGRVDLNRFTTGTYASTNPVVTHSPARPGQTLVAWGTGLGPIDTPDNAPPGATDVRSLAEISVVVGTREIVPSYAGRAPEFPGVDVVNFELPLDVETGCSVPFQVRAGGRLSNRTTVAIAPTGADSCFHREASKDVLKRLDEGGTMVTGWFVLNSESYMETIYDFYSWPAIDEWAGGGFFRYTADQLPGAFGPTADEGTCRVLKYSGTWEGLAGGSGGTPLDAGSELEASGPGGNWRLVRRNGFYFGGNHIDLAGPTQTLAGKGGNDIGAFTARVGQSPPLVVGAISDQIDRSAGLTIRWSGGGTSLVSVLGMAGSLCSAFVCTARAEWGSVTVPSSVLTQAVPIASLGELIVIVEDPAGNNNGRFAAPLTVGGATDYAIWLSLVHFETLVSFN